MPPAACRIRRLPQGSHGTQGLIGIPTRLDRRGVVYHTSRDTVDHIEKKAVEAGLDILAHWILQKDAETESVNPVQE